jgi:hypothetical protein
MNHERPRTVQEAVEQLVLKLSQTDKISIAEVEEHDLISLHFGLGQVIRNEYGLWHDNNLPLLLDCHRIKGKDVANLPGLRIIHPDDASMVIIQALWRRLRDQ